MWTLSVGRCRAFFSGQPFLRITGRWSVLLGAVIFSKAFKLSGPETMCSEKGVSISTVPKVLLVEDNQMNRDMLSRRLTRRGFDLVMAVDGRQGVEMAGTENPDLILMDMSLPVLDGWAATRKIKADSRTRDIPVIALTAHAMAGDREKAMQAGCDDYDTKPIELSRLLDKIGHLLKNSRMHDRSTDGLTGVLTCGLAGELTGKTPKTEGVS
jgi:two-component system cell cycle response regulator DivK